MKPYTSKKKIRLVLADVDGTLVTKDKVLTERAQKAVHALHERDIHFAITSGRPPLGMKMLIEPLELKTPIAGFNGGVYMKPDFSVISMLNLAPDVAAETLKLMAQHGLVAWLYTDKDWFVPDPKGPHAEREAWTVKMTAKVSSDFTPELGKAAKIVGVCDDLPVMAKAEADCQEKLKGRASAQTSQPYYLDVTNPEANKGSVAVYLAKYYNLDLEEIAVLGDMPNDVPMFRKAGLSIAMGQASDYVKGEANFVSASFADEGFAKGIEDHILSR